MGRVLLASQGSLDREVTVKSALRADREAALALLLEGVIIARCIRSIASRIYQAELVSKLATDCVLVATGLVVAALSHGRWLLWGALVAVVGGAVLMIERNHPAVVANLVALTGVVVLLVTQRAAARAAKRP